MSTVKVNSIADANGANSIEVANLASKSTLSGTGGAGTVGFGTDTVDGALKKIQDANIFFAPYNAKGDGVTNDTAAFTAWEAAFPGTKVDLRGKTMLVDAVPTKCAYTNGKFKLAAGFASGYSRPALDSNSFLNQPGRYAVNGGQLNAMHRALTDPFFQFVGIVMIGDSITWGSGTGENLPFDPRNGTLKDPRDSSKSPSYVNLFKQYIGKNYGGDATPILSNFPFSPQGESIATYIKDNICVPDGPGFTVTQRGGAVSSSRIAATGLASGWQYRYSNANVSGGTAYHEIEWVMTGKSFTLALSCVATSCISYEVFVNDVSQGVFTTTPGSAADGGLVFVDATNNNMRTHTFPFARDAKIRIRTVRNPSEGATQTLRVDGIILKKTIRIANQGINGTIARNFYIYAMGPSAISFSGDYAVKSDDSFATIQLGSNDRGMTAEPQTIGMFQQQMTTLIQALPTGVQPIIMCANPAVDNPVAKMKMWDIRSALHQLGRQMGIDFVDNYSAWADSDPKSLANDGLHPNPNGFTVMAQNLIRSMETAHDPWYVKPVVPPPLFNTYPLDAAKFNLIRVGTNVDEIDREAAAAIMGRQYLIRHSNVATPDTSYHRLRFTLANSTRLWVYYSQNGSALDFEIYINGVLNGQYTTDGTAVYQQYYKIPLPADSKTVPVQVELRTKRRADFPTGTSVLYLEAFAADTGATFTALA